MIGRRLLHYEIVEKLGEGGMAVVYKARDPRLDRFVALKILPADRSGDPTRRARFVREARAAAALNHPHIVTVHDIAYDDGLDFIVMEHLGGQPLSQVVGEKGLPVAEALRIAIQVADALAAAHAAGVIHRDLKPANVMIGGDGRAKVLDFGLATLAAGEGASAPERLTRDGVVMGTIAYMSPEQSLGQPADARSDVFSLGVMLYEMLAGLLPFRSRSAAEHFHLLHYSSPAPLRALRRAVPESVERLVGRALERSPEARFASMREMEQALRRLAVELAATGDAPVDEEDQAATSLDPEANTLDRSTDPVPGPPLPRPPPSRPPAPGTERASIAVLPFASLSGDPDDGYVAAGIASEIIVALGGVPDLRVTSELASFRFRGPDLDLANTARTLRVRYLLTGSFRRGGDRIRVLAALADAETQAQIWSKAFDRKMTELFAMQEEIAQAIVGATGGQILRADADRAHGSSPEHLDAWGLLHRAYYFWNHAFTPDGLEQALGQVRRAVVLDPGYAAAHAFLGLYLIERVIHVFTPRIEEERAEAEAAAEKAVQLAPGDTNVLANAGLVWYHCSRHERSVGALRRAVEIAPFNLVAWGYLALSLGVGGDDAEVEEARRILDRLLDTTPDHPSVPYWFFFKGAVSTRQGRLEEAAECAARTVELQPHFFLASVMLANAFGARGRRAEARAAWEHVRDIHPSFAADDWAREIRLQAVRPDRAEPHLAGLRAAEILA
ncbi:MAG TPA: protein kinase [Vicinamibacteria bacterium]|nr:protein kinase [Vicinamibacteria bacterium]